MQYCSNVVSSPHPELTVLKEDPPSVPHFVLNALKSYSGQTALVGHCPVLHTVTRNHSKSPNLVNLNSEIVMYRPKI